MFIYLLKETLDDQLSIVVNMDMGREHLLLDAQKRRSIILNKRLSQSLPRASIIHSIFWSKHIRIQVSLMKVSNPFFAKLLGINSEIVLFCVATFSRLIKYEYSVYLHTNLPTVVSNTDLCFRF